MKKKFLSLLLTLLPFMASAYDFKVDGIYYNITDSEKFTVEVTNNNYTEYKGNVVIPESVIYSDNTYSVMSIGQQAFDSDSSLTSITIPNSVTSIGYSAFYKCTGLTSITIPNSVESIGLFAFDKTAWYDNQPDGVVYAGKVLYKYKGVMPENTSITVKDVTLSICGYAFSGCSGLTSITIPNSVTSIGDRAFYGCSSLTSISIPNSVTSIGEGTFYGCSSLTSISIPNSVTSIGKDTFHDCI